METICQSPYHDDGDEANKHGTCTAPRCHRVGGDGLLRAEAVQVAWATKGLHTVHGADQFAVDVNVANVLAPSELLDEGRAIRTKDDHAAIICCNKRHHTIGSFVRSTT